MRRLILGLALSLVVALPFGSSPVSAGEQNVCPDGYYPVPIQEIQASDPRPGAARAASAADVNHNSLVCAKERGNGRGVTYTDDIGFN